MLPSDRQQSSSAPWPGSQSMPRWDTGELIDAPRFTWKNLLAMVGPGLVMGAAAIGGGEWLSGPAVTAKYGPSLLWIATVSIFFQVIYNVEISRYTLYTGEPIFTGKLRTLPHPWFWVVLYLMLDWGAVAPVLTVNAAIPVETMILGRQPDPALYAGDWWFHKGVSTTLYLLALIPLLCGGKVYNSLKVVMSIKLVTVFGFLLIVGLLFARPATWGQIVGGLFQFGSLPVMRGEDRNGNGQLDPGEDFDGDGRLDDIEREKKDGNGAVNGFIDTDGDQVRDGVNVDNIFVSLWRGEAMPPIDFSLIAVIAALAAIAGNGGLTNAPISNFTRDQGWGMGYHVGAIPSIVGGHGVSLSHVGCVFAVNEQSLPRWRRWLSHVRRDQWIVWMLACLVGVSLPSILSVEFLPRGTDVTGWNVASMSSSGVHEYVNQPREDALVSRLGLQHLLAGPGWARFLSLGALSCGLLVLFTSQITTTDGFVRRWVDVLWTASASMRQLSTDRVRHVYFAVLSLYALCGLAILWYVNDPLATFKVAMTGYNYALAFSAWHTIVINVTLLPKALRPGWLSCLGLFLGGCFFTFLGIMSTLKLLGKI